MIDPVAARAVIERVLDEFKKSSARPTKIIHGVDGRTTLRWHVDDCDDRFVELRDSADSADWLVLVRDCRAAEATVVGAELGDIESLESCLERLVVGELDRLCKNESEGEKIKRSATYGKDQS